MTTHPANVLLLQFPFCLQIGQFVFDHLKNTCGEINTTVGSSGRVIEHRTANRGDGGSIPPTTVLKLEAVSFTPHLPVFRKRHKKPLVPSIWCLCQGK